MRVVSPLFVGVHQGRRYLMYERSLSDGFELFGSEQEARVRAEQEAQEEHQYRHVFHVEGYGYVVLSTADAFQYFPGYTQEDILYSVAPGD